MSDALKTLESEPIDPAQVPQRTLRSGAKVPAIGFGTFGSDRTPPSEIARAVAGAFEVGYRHFDCAAVHQNERDIGEVFAGLFAGGVSREELWITSKLWNDNQGERHVLRACERTLADLRLDYLDLYLVHWPFPNYHPSGCGARSPGAGAKPYIHEYFVRTWRQMERLVDIGLVRHIGTSNMTVPKMRLLLQDARIPPEVNGMELHPHFQQPQLFDFVRSHGIEAIGYSPMGSPNRRDREGTTGDTRDLDDPVILRIAESHGCDPTAVCLKWAVQRGQTPIAMSTKRTNYEANLRAVSEDPLSPEEMYEIAVIDRNCRLNKGQVFLWRDDQNWEDLWDINGEITLA